MINKTFGFIFLCSVLLLCNPTASLAGEGHLALIDQLPEKGLQDRDVELDMTLSAREWAKSWKWDYDVLYSYATDVNWTLIYHPLDSSVTGRKITGVIATQSDANGCMLHYAVFAQELNSEDFGSVRMISLLPRHHHISCDKL